LIGNPEISRPSRNPDRKPNFKPQHDAETLRYEDRKPHEGVAKPKFDGTGYKGRKPFPDDGKPKFEGTGYKGKKPFAAGKPKFEGAGKSRAEGDTTAFKEKKAAWKKKKR
jgi:hypothetical protein